MKKMELSDRPQNSNEWSPAESAILSDVIRLIRGRQENGYPPEDCSVVFVPEEDAIEHTIDDEFVTMLLEELEEIQDNGRSFMSYHIAEATGDVEGMMGLNE